MLSSDYPNAPVVVAGGKMYKIIGGAAYEVSGNNLIFVQQLYDPGFYAANYQTEGGVIYRLANGTRYPVFTALNEHFDGATIRDLVGPAPKQWTAITLQSPKAPSVAEYVALRNAILNGTGTFLDNRIEPSAIRTHGCAKSLRALAVAPSAAMVQAGYVSKASLECELLHFMKGEHFWFDGWFYIAQGKPLGLLDLESTWISEYPGLRILLDDNRRPRIELKWADKPTYTASAVLPYRKWVRLRMHALLSDDPAIGRIDLAIDDAVVIGTAGQTLPLPDTLYNLVEIGITAAGSAAEVFCDEVKVGREQLW